MPEPPPADGPAAEHGRRREHWRPRAQRLRHAERRLGTARLIVFFVGLAFCLWVMKSWPTGWPTMLMPLAAFFVLVVRHGRVAQARRQADAALAFHERALARMEGRWAGTGPTGETHVPPGHLYAADLDLFGEGSVFQLLATTRTMPGEATLARWLLAPADADTVHGRQGAVTELAPDVDLREEIALLGEGRPDEVDADALATWAAAEPVVFPALARPLAGLLALAAVTTTVGWAFLGWSFGPLGVALFVEALFDRWCDARIEVVARRLLATGHQLPLLAELLALLEARRFGSPRLVALAEGLDGRQGAPSENLGRLEGIARLLQDSRRNVFLVLLAFGLQLRLHWAHAAEAWRRELGPALPAWLDAAGELDALAALAAHAYENPDHVLPEVVEAGPRFEAEGLGHPLLPADRCVRNDVHLDEQRRLLLISGSNMSGKSTLLRAVGVGAVLALAGAPVRARRLVLSPLEVGCSIHIVDSLREGASHFYAEITRLKAIEERTREQRPVLFLLDEILHGTNSAERLRGAEAVVKTLVGRGAIGLVTTHDLALARLADELAPRATNGHFEDQLVDGRMSFDFRLREGVVQRGNALELMRSLGLDV